MMRPLVLFLLLSTPVFASIIITPGSHPSPGQENIYFTTAQSGSTVWGVDPAGTRVEFTAAPGGTLGVLAHSSTVYCYWACYPGVTLSIPGHTFQNLVFNAYAGPGPGPHVDMEATITASTGNTHWLWQTSGGPDYWTVSGTQGTQLETAKIGSIYLTYQDLQNVSVAGVSCEDPVSVPEGPALLFLGTGLVMASWRLRFR